MRKIIKVFLDMHEIVVIRSERKTRIFLDKRLIFGVLKDTLSDDGKVTNRLRYNFPIHMFKSVIF